MSINQTAGKVTVAAWKDGWPVSIEVSYEQWNGELTTFRMNPEHLHDLRYCIDRVLARLEADGGAGE